jgi:hypothetical protein
MFSKGYITPDFDSAEVFRGIGVFCQFFALKDFLSYRLLKKVWADPPTAVRFRVKETIKVKTNKSISNRYLNTILCCLMKHIGYLISQEVENGGEVCTWLKSTTRGRE